MSKTIAYLIAVGSLVGMCFGAYFFVENRYAQAETVKQLGQRLDEKIKSDRVNAIQERIWKIEDRCLKRPPTDTEKEELRMLKENKEKLQRELK